MALESWLIKVKTAISNGVVNVKATSKSKNRAKVGVLAFEISALMSKLLQLWQSLSNDHITQLRNEAISLEGVNKLISDDDSFLLCLARAEMVENLRLAARSVSRFSKLCDDLGLQSFDRFFEEFADSGHDTRRWAMTRKEMESMVRKMKRYIAATAALHKEMDQLSETEQGVKKLMEFSGKESPASIKLKKLAELQQKLFWQTQEVKCKKQSSLWSRSFDVVTLMLVRSVFTILCRIKLVFGIRLDAGTEPESFPSIPRSLSASTAAVHPSETSSLCKFMSGPLISKYPNRGNSNHGFFFSSNANLLKPPPSTLGAVALALHYANLILVIEKMVRLPHLISIDARDDLYSMLPTSVRSMLRERLRGIGYSASDPVLAGEWREAMWRILEWLAPLAHNMIRWQNERSFEQQRTASRPTGVLLLQTLYFANQAMAEAAITEILVGLNYIWRFEKEMNAKAILQCSKINPLMQFQASC